MLRINDLKELCAGFSELNVVVLGDMMLDSYQWGKVQRISPEAPVPIIEINREEYRLGGAANVALNLASLGAKVMAIGVIGNGPNASRMQELFISSKLDSSGLIRDESRKTTIKTRIGAANQQIVRIDHEDTHYINPSVREKVLAKLQRHLRDSDVLIIEDYNKGLLSPELIRDTLAFCKNHQVRVSVDPKQKNFFAYAGVDIFKPNFLELQSNLGQHFETEDEFFVAARQLLQKMELVHLVVTRGSKGMYVFSVDQQPQHLPSSAREVFDVSGAGDTVISALSLAYAAGASIFEAADLASQAAGVVCGKMGTASASREEILEYIHAVR
ncbi:MAG: D-glycero-beta-D-manno-heptose-7-phosphate kinase [Candidatus Cloacimonetes bacterium]|jgi:rfaE bifunctional protein kinase chain/domain|nr:D-glycero-beta-D-manno-heptose-7-phosphate kinase [Candidatus Cloacimonadota bacterium]MDD4035011.1 D-glycero-beta-D-manno-heptose-7-phosphate kinase [Candidatus Cloacimonadota bacterium]MDY0337572.1 D-glycero-beta-D-manno-heptose-7-phosphate kinase [Candidatus Cloacimonadaceae bacterium]